MGRAVPPQTHQRKPTRARAHVMPCRAVPTHARARARAHSCRATCRDTASPRDMQVVVDRWSGRRRNAEGRSAR